MLTVGSLFAGVGGFDLGLERTGGFRTVWQVEKDEYARRVLAKHWPDVRRWDDVKTFPPKPASEWGCDLICGGFPCQDISNAGKRVGIDGKQSGLWGEFARVLRILRPRFVLVENSEAITFRGLGRVLGDLSALGFDAEWSTIPACAMGAPHTRERLFLVAYSGGRQRFNRQRPGLEFQTCSHEAGDFREVWLQPEPCRMAHGTPHLVDRLRALGNAIVPQVAEWIGRQLLAALGPLAAGGG